MLFLHPDKIIVKPERQRKFHDINKHQELCASIEATGLLHPPVVRREGDSWVLVAGERRLRAITQLIDFKTPFRVVGDDEHSSNANLGRVPCLSIGSLSPIQAEEAELEENIHRQDLTWQERAAATARLMNLRKAQAATSDAPPPTPAALAEELERTPTSVKEDLMVAKHLDDPVVAKAKTAGEALKHLRKVEERQRMELRAASVLSAATPLHLTHTLKQGDCLKVMLGIPNCSFQVILTDPPYGMGAHEFGDSAGASGGQHHYDDSFEHWKSLMAKVVPELYRVADHEAAAYLFCDLDNFHALKDMMTEAGWRVHRTPILWLRPHGQRVPWPENGPRRAWELCLYAIKGHPKVNHLENDYVIAAPDENLGHSAQKPVDLMKNLLARIAKPGHKVFDPFMGTASVLPAVHEALCTYYGIELDLASYGIATTRLATLK